MKMTENNCNCTFLFFLSRLLTNVFFRPCVCVRVERFVWEIFLMLSGTKARVTLNVKTKTKPKAATKGLSKPKTVISKVNSAAKPRTRGADVVSVIAVRKRPLQTVVSRNPPLSRETVPDGKDAPQYVSTPQTVKRQLLPASDETKVWVEPEAPNETAATKRRRVTTKIVDEEVGEEISRTENKSATPVTTTESGNVTTTASGDVTTTESGNVTTTASGNVTTTASGNVTTTASGDVTTTASGDETENNASQVVSRPSEPRTGTLTSSCSVDMTSGGISGGGSHFLTSGGDGSSSNRLLDARVPGEARALVSFAPRSSFVVFSVPRVAEVTSKHSAKGIRRSSVTVRATSHKQTVKARETKVATSGVALLPPNAKHAMSDDSIGKEKGQFLSVPVDGRPTRASDEKSDRTSADGAWKPEEGKEECEDAEHGHGDEEDEGAIHVKRAIPFRKLRTNEVCLEIEPLDKSLTIALQRTMLEYGTSWRGFVAVTRCRGVVQSQMIRANVELLPVYVPAALETEMRRRARTTALSCRTCAVFADWPCIQPPRGFSVVRHSAASAMAAAAAGGHSGVDPSETAEEPMCSHCSVRFTFKADYDPKCGMTSSVTSSTFVWLPPPWYPDFLTSHHYSRIVSIAVNGSPAPSSLSSLPTHIEPVSTNATRPTPLSTSSQTIGSPFDTVALPSTTATLSPSSSLSLTPSERDHKGERLSTSSTRSDHEHKNESRTSHAHTHSNVACATEENALEVPYVLPGALLTHLTRNQALDMTLTATRGSKFTHKKCRFIPVTTIAATAIYDVRIHELLQTSTEQTLRALTGREKLAIYGSCSRRVFQLTKRPIATTNTSLGSTLSLSTSPPPSSSSFSSSSSSSSSLALNKQTGSVSSSSLALNKRTGSILTHVESSSLCTPPTRLIPGKTNDAVPDVPDVPPRACSDRDMEDLGMWLQRGGNIDLTVQSPDYCNGCMDCVRTAASFGMTDAVVVTRNEQRQRLRFRTVLEPPKQVFTESVEVLSKRLRLLQSALIRYRTDLLNLERP
jgi:hypothetical protein